jgi:hypothetical protein
MAKHAHTTDADRRRSSRRASSTPLLAAVARFHAAHAAMLDVGANDAAPWEEVQTTGSAWNKAAAALCKLTPATTAELAAKAFAVALVLRVTVGNFKEPDSFDESAECMSA